MNLNRFTINTSLVPARDAVLGIVLGIVAMWLVFDHLWAQTSSASVRSLFLGTLRNVANFKAGRGGSSEEANQRLAAESSRINRDFDKLRDLADMYAFESFPKKPRESLVNRSIRTLLPELRAFLLVKTGLLQHRSLAARTEDRGAYSGGRRESLQCASWIGECNRKRSHLKNSSPWNARIEEVRARSINRRRQLRDAKDQQKHTEMRLCASLLDLVSKLERRARLNFVQEAEVAKGIDKWSVGRPAEAQGNGVSP